MKNFSKLKTTRFPVKTIKRKYISKQKLLKKIKLFKRLSKKDFNLKKVIGLGITAWIFKYSVINSNTLPTVVGSVHSTSNERLIPVSYKKTDTGNYSIQFKTGSGVVLEIQNQYNTTSEVLKYSLETRCGDLGNLILGPERSLMLINILKLNSLKYQEAISFQVLQRIRHNISIAFIKTVVD